MIYSQHGEDAVLAALFEEIGVTNRCLVDIGAGDGYRFSNTRSFIEQGWTGLLLDRELETEDVHKLHVTAENITEILEHYGVPHEFDLLSIDIDGIDWYVLRSLLHAQFRPRVFIAEVNPDLPADPPVVVEYDPMFAFEKCRYYGASLGAYELLGDAFGYRCICIHRSLNAVFVQADLTQKRRGLFHPVNAWPEDPRRRSWLRITITDC